MRGYRCKELDNGRFHTFMLSLFSLMFVYDFFIDTKIPRRLLFKDPFIQIPQKIDLLEPFETNETIKVKTRDVYTQLIDIKNFTFKMNPQPCKEYSEGLLLVVIVSSNAINFDNRAIIRSTWGESVDSTKVVFLLGETSDYNISQKIKFESSIYSDIVQGSFIDAYRNMTYKHVMGFKWVTHHCPMAKYVLKVDDDIVVNMIGLRRFLAGRLSPWGARDLIACQMYEHAPVSRTNDSKWMVSHEEYGQDFYPPYCSGCTESRILRSPQRDVT